MILMKRRTSIRDDHLTRGGIVGDERHFHNWVLDRDVAGRNPQHGTRYYHCSGCPLTKSENY